MSLIFSYSGVLVPRSCEWRHVPMDLLLISLFFLFNLIKLFHNITRVVFIGQKNTIVTKKKTKKNFGWHLHLSSVGQKNQTLSQVMVPFFATVHETSSGQINSYLKDIPRKTFDHHLSMSISTNKVMSSCFSKKKKKSNVQLWLIIFFTTWAKNIDQKQGLRHM